MAKIASKALVVFSGGQDSTTCLGWAKNRFDTVESITFDYGQKHRVEIAQAQKIAQIMGVKNTLLSLDAFSQLNDSALIDGDLDISSSHRTHTNLPASFVPNRNAIFFTLAHAFAQKQGIEHIIIGVNQTDYSGYPDCREPFVKALELAPGDPGASQGLAALAVQAKDYDAARGYFDGVLAKHPDYLPAHMQLAALDLAQGDETGMVKRLQQLIAA